MSKTLTKTLSLVLAIVMVLGLGAFNVLADDETYVARIGDESYTTLDAALADVGAGDVTITLLQNIDNPAKSITARDKFGTNDTTKLTIDGGTGKHTLKIYMTDTDWNSIGMANPKGTLCLKNLNIGIERAGGNGAWNNHALNLIGGSFELENVEIDSSFSVDGNTSLTNVTVNEAGAFYGFIVKANVGEVTVNNLTVNAPNGGRGIKIMDEYVDESVRTNVKLSVSNSKFNTAKKAAVLVTNTAGAEIDWGEGNDISGVQADSKNAVWIDEARVTNADKVTVTGANCVVENKQAKIGNAYYSSLEDAFAAAQDSDTITLLADCAGNGIVAQQGKFATGLTVDFDGHTYTVDGDTVGSTGTETNGFQLLKDNKITFKDGTITSAKAKILIQNYSNLTLDGMTLTLNNPNYTSAYTLSNNNGIVTIKDTTINANPAGGFAFDVCRYSSYPSVSVTVEGNSVINGNIEFDVGKSDPKDGAHLTIENGTINGQILPTANGGAALNLGNSDATITISGGTFSSKPDAKYIAENRVIKSEAGKYVVSVAEAGESAIVVPENAQVNMDNDNVKAFVEAVAGTPVQSTAKDNAEVESVAVELTEVKADDTTGKITKIVFDVTPEVVTGASAHNLTNPLTVTIPLPTTIDLNDVQVVHKNKIVTIERLTEQHAIRFSSKDFSPYEIYVGRMQYTIDVIQVASDDITLGTASNTKPTAVDQVYHSGNTVYEALVVTAGSSDTYQGASFSVTYNADIFTLDKDGTKKATGVTVGTPAINSDTKIATVTVHTETTANYGSGSTVLAILPLKVNSTKYNSTTELGVADDRQYDVGISGNLIAYTTQNEVAASTNGDKVDVKNFYKLTLTNPDTLVSGDEGLKMPGGAVTYQDSKYLKYNAGESISITNYGVIKNKYDYSVAVEGATGTFNPVDGTENENSTVTIPWNSITGDLTVTLTATPNSYTVALGTGSEPVVTAQNGTESVADKTATYGTKFNAFIKDFDDDLYNYRYTVKVGNAVIVNDEATTSADISIDGGMIKGAENGAAHLTITVTKTMDAKVAIITNDNSGYISGWRLVLVGVKAKKGFTYAQDATTATQMIEDLRYTDSETLLDVDERELSSWSTSGYTHVYAVLTKDEVTTAAAVIAKLTETDPTSDVVEKDTKDVNYNGSTNYNDVLQTYRAYNKSIHNTEVTGDNPYDGVVLDFMKMYLLADVDNNGMVDTDDVSALGQYANTY